MRLAELSRGGAGPDEETRDPADPRRAYMISTGLVADGQIDKRSTMLREQRRQGLLTCKQKQKNDGHPLQ